MWIERVDTQYKPLAQVLINHCDWSWTQSARLPDAKPLSASHIADYQVFILCKVIAGDLKVDAETKRLRLSPTEQIDDVWHLHLLRPVSYFDMCWKLHEARQQLLAEDKTDDETLEGKEFVGLGATEGRRTVLLGDKTFHPLDCVIDHTPESSKDTVEVLYERYKVTKSYLVKLCPGYIFSNPPLDPTDMGTSFFNDPFEDREETENCPTAESPRANYEENSIGEDFLQTEEPLPEELLTVILRTISGADREIYGLNPNMKVVDLMRRYQAMEGVPVDQQRYIYGGQQMNEEDRLRDYNIENNSVICLVLRLRC